MSITGAFMRRGAARERRAVGPWGSGDVIPAPSQGASAAGVSVSEGTALSIMTVLGCVGLLADAVSTLPIDGFYPAADGRREIVPKPRLLSQPWSEITSQDWYAQATMSMALRGNFYGLPIEVDDMGFPQQIQPLHPDQVLVRRNTNNGRREYVVAGHGTLQAGEVFHVPYITSPGQLVGINPIAACRQGLALTLAAEASGAQFFANGTLASGVITSPGDLTQEQTNALAASWAQAHQGYAKAHLPAVLTGGATWTQLSVNPDDAQFLGTRAFQRAEIAMMFRVPPHMIGDVDRTTSWGTGIEQQEIGFVTNTLRGYIGRLEQALTQLLPGHAQRGDYAKFNVAGRLRGDTLQRYQAYTMARNGSWMNVDEIREREDMPPLPNGIGQDYWAPLNFAPIGQAPADVLPTGSTPATEGSGAPLEALVEAVVRRYLDAQLEELVRRSAS